MKYNFLFFVLLGLTNCQQSPSSEHNPIQITGSIANTLTPKAWVVSIYGQQEVEITDGSFQKTLYSDQATILNLIVGNSNVSLFVQPGDSLHLDYGTEPDSRPTIKGGLVEENHFLTDLSDSLRAKVGSPWSIYRQPEEAALAKVAAIDSYGTTLLEAYLKDHPKTNSEFQELTKKYISYFTGQYITKYPTFYAKANPDDTTYQASEALRRKMADLQAERPNLLNLPLYIDVLKSKKMAKVNQLRREDSSLQNMEGYLKVNRIALESEFSNPSIVEMMTYHHISEFILFYGTDGIEDTYEDFMAKAQNEALKKEIKKQYSDWAHLAKGKVAPDFNYRDIKDNSHALSDYRGKVVYIDVWATWCGPCLAEQPYLAKMEEEYEGNENIVFMGVSIDADRAAWQAMVNQKEMTGVQLYAEGAWDSKIIQDYRIYGIPRFILINADGKIVDATAYPPSKDKLKNQLKALLEGAPMTG